MERLARAANYISSPLLPPSRFLWDHNCQWEGERGRFRHARGRPIVLRITFLRVGRLPWYQRLWPKYSRRWGTCAAALMVHKRNRAPTKCQPTW